MHFLMIHLLRWGRATGYRRMNLGMAPLSGLEPPPPSPMLHRAGQAGFRVMIVSRRSATRPMAVHVLRVLMCVLTVSCFRQERHQAALPASIAPGNGWRALTVGVAGREFLLHVPPQWAPSRVMPLLVVLHGTHGDAEEMVDRTGLNDAADKRGFLVAYPNGTGFLKYLTWNVGGNCCGSALKGEVDDVAFLLAIVEDVRRAAHIDARRVYVAGFSDGGMLAFRAACDAADKIAAIGVVAGRMPDISCKPKRPVPLIIFTGSKDPEVNTDFDRYITPQSFGYARGVDSTLAFWTHMNGCAAVPALVMEGRHVRRTWRQCRARSRVVSYTVTDAAHEWPGAKRDGSDNGTVRDLSATEHMLDFFGPRQRARPNPRRPSSAPAALVRKDTVSVRQTLTRGEGFSRGTRPRHSIGFDRQFVHPRHIVANEAGDH